jgi:Xaa-Pro aminopeptidase
MMNTPTTETAIGVLISQEEFRLRQQKVAESAKRRDLAGILCWSKCAGTYDGYGDAVYLANHYSYFPHIRDFKPHWTTHGHVPVIIPADGDPVVIVDLETFRDDLIAISDIRFYNDVVRGAAEALKERGMASERVGLSGSELLPIAARAELSKHLPTLELVEADEVVEDLRMIKSPAEIEMLRTTGRVGAEAFNAMMRAAIPGNTEADAVAAAVDIITRAGGALYQALVASGPNDGFAAWNPLPGYDASRQLEEGDFFHCDMYAPVCGGYLFDYSRSKVVGDTANQGQRDLLEVSVGSVHAVIDALEIGAPVGLAARAGDAFLKEQGYSEQSGDGGVDAKKDLFAAWGHGFGLTWERPWLIEDDETLVEQGMCLAVERFVSRPDVGTVAFEQNVVMLESGPEILSGATIRWW